MGSQTGWDRLVNSQHIARCFDHSGTAAISLVAVRARRLTRRSFAHGLLNTYELVPAAA